SLDVPDGRRDAIRRLAEALPAGGRVALTTHINADGDGCGSEAALARLLRQRGIDAFVVNPTPWPEMYDFLLGDDVRDRSPEGALALARIDALVTLDISDVKRLGQLTDAVRALRVPKLVIDHHIASDEPAGDVALADTSACATGELVFDLARELGLELDPAIATALYAAILTDTGGFRYSNTTPRCHAIAGALLAAGVDPERMYQRIYASVPMGKLRLLGEALATLEADDAHGLAWLSIDADALERFGLRSEDLEGIVEHARSIEGTRIALFFRDLGHGRVKVSFRSTGDADVNALARRFGGGGHAKASGAMIAGSLEEVRERVLAAAREVTAR
ncbi:MAG TPA: bifunctional oligoribonuclease/PAP phosphatase NrnA, partial [Gemmatimonadaceae bacterium]